MTYKILQEHLQREPVQHINDTVVQLCSVRNRRRINAQRYKGVAAIICKRARKDHVDVNKNLILIATGHTAFTKALICFSSKMAPIK